MPLAFSLRIVLCELKQRRLRLDGRAALDEHACDRPRALRVDLVHHLHRLDDGDDLTFADRLALRSDLDDHPMHRRENAGTLVVTRTVAARTRGRARRYRAARRSGAAAQAFVE